MKMCIPEVVFSRKMGTEQMDRVLDFVGSFVFKFSYDNDVLVKTFATVYWQNMYYGSILVANIPLYVVGIVPQKELEDLKLGNSKRVRIDRVFITQEYTQFLAKDSGPGTFLVNLYKKKDSIVDLPRPDWFVEDVYTKEDSDAL